MPQPKKGPSLGSNPSHQRLMLRNLAHSLFQHERVKTTEPKAKLLRPYAEKLITKAKNGSVHHRRLVLSEIEDRSVVHKLFADIAPRFSERNGGYTRIVKLGPRNGDGAPMALIELVEGGPGPARPAAAEDTTRRRRLRRPGRRRQAAEAQDEASAPAEDEVGAPAEAASDAGTAAEDDEEERPS